MSTKTIAVDSGVYARLAAAKREGESFSKTIDRLLTTAGAAHTGAEIIEALSGITPLPGHEADVYFRIVAENRDSERWEPT